MRFKSAKRYRSGFSLFELLMSVAILGIMGSFAISAFGNQTEVVQDTRNLRNAQAVAATCAAAKAAGLNFVVGMNLDSTVRNIIKGAAPTSGAFKNRVFKVNLIGDEDVPGTIRYLKIQDGELLVHHD